MKKSHIKKVKPNPFPLRLYELKAPVVQLAKARGISMNDAIIDLIKTSLERGA